MIFTFLDELLPFLDEDGVTEVVINRPKEAWIENFHGWRKEEITLSYSELISLANLTANLNKKNIDKDNPIFSGALPDGERIQIVIPPACKAGDISFTIRKPSMVDKSLAELEAEGAFELVQKSKSTLLDFEHELIDLKEKGFIKEFLDLAVRKKRNIVVAGKTGSGKTTITKSLIRSIPLDERLISIEDVHELFLNQHENKVHLFYTRENEKGFNVDAKSALASCLRMKPDRILLAELRGDEAWEFVKSINTGHPGSITTMHAGSALETFDQMTSFIKDSATGAHLDADYIMRRLFSTIDIVLHYENRKLMEIYYDPQKKLDLLMGKSL